MPKPVKPGEPLPPQAGKFRRPWRFVRRESRSFWAKELRASLGPNSQIRESNWLFLLVILSLLCFGLPARAASPPSTGEGQTGRAPQVVVPGTVALEMEAEALATVLSNQVHVANQAQKAESSASSNTKFVLILAFMVAGVVVFRIVAPRLGEWHHQRFDPWASASTGADSVAEERVFSRFAEAFTAGPVAAPRGREPGSPFAGQTAIAQEPAAPIPDPLAEFLAKAPKDLTAMRGLLAGVSRATDPVERQKILGELSLQAGALKGRSGLPELLPLWQVSCALESLLQQLIKKPANVTSSVLRSLASALDLLNSLCQPGLKTNLLAEPPVHILAVDDDAICRHAISFSLKKVLSAPDLANDGPAALVLAEGTAYDAIFLDVEMPGMDGFELCTRIHATTSNRITPVVFVTRHADFDARAKSSLTGARDLIGKPFLTFEVALKALTLVLNRRLQAQAHGLMGLGEEGASNNAQIGRPAPEAPPNTACTLVHAS